MSGLWVTCLHAQIKVNAMLNYIMRIIFINNSINISVVCVCVCMRVHSCLILCDPMDCSHLAPLSMGFSRQEY